MDKPINNDKTLIFFDYPSSPCARRVRISLFEKGLPHHIELVDLGRQEQKTPAFKQVNPWGKVPALIDQGRPLWESNVITQYLDEAYTGARLYPEDWRAYARVRYWQDFELYFAQSFFMLMYQRMAGLGLRIAKDYDVMLAEMRERQFEPAFIDFMARAWRGEVLSPAEIKATEEFLLAVAARIEHALADGRPFLSGEEFGQADIALLPRLNMFSWLGLSLETCPQTRAWMQRVSRRDSVRHARSQSERLLGRPQIRWIMAWADRALAKPQSQRSSFERAGLKLLRKKLAGDQIAADRARADKHNHARQSALPARRDALETVQPLDLSIRLQACAELPEHAALIAVLDHLGMAYDWQAIDLMDSEMASGRRLPAAAVYRWPAVTLDGDVAVCGLAPILDVLARIRPEVDALLPADPYLRARARIWIVGDADGEQKYLRDALDQWHLGRALCGRLDEIDARIRAGTMSVAAAQRLRRAVAGKLCSAAQAEAAREYLQGRYQQVETALREGPWLLGDAFSLADVVELQRLCYFTTWSGLALSPDIVEWQRRVEGQQARERAA